MTRGRKKLYTPEITKKITDLIAETGSDKVAYDAVGLSRTTFYQWLNDADKTDFSDAVKVAREKYANKNETKAWSRIEAANSYIDDVLQGKRFKITKQQVIGGNGRIVTLIKEEQIVPSDKLLDRVLGQSPTDVPFEVRFGIAEPEELDET
jgi:hypothetical protein